MNGNSYFKLPQKLRKVRTTTRRVIALDYTNKCGSCAYFKNRNITRSPKKGDCKLNRSWFSGVTMGKPKCKKYKLKEVV